MNCPHCHVTIGNDLHRIGPWGNDIDCDTGQVLGCRRTLIIFCDHCGVFTATQSGDRSITAINQIANPRDRRRYMRKIPGARFAEVCA